MEKGVKLFVNHLPTDWKESTIYEYFSAYGRISDVFLFKHLSNSLGCAYVRFALKSEGEETMAKLNHSQVQ